MQTILFIGIIVFGSSSYIVGVRQMLRGDYSPSTFSRVIWVLLALNSFAGVLLSGSSQSSILLGTILLIGNIAVCIVSFWKGTKTIGKLEYVCIFLLIVSGLVWIFFRAPLINLVISLIAHFIGATPTYKKVWQNPKSESTSFWSLFFIASLLSIFASQSNSFEVVILPIYFTFFDGSIFILSLRRFLTDKEAKN
ncbi:MAG TPA: hypothetical protein VMR73_01060 [Candidatus Paceibacterota bacterium]|nr:hypothetical protein [Candidatus Paceibacterota bacterium]